MEELSWTGQTAPPPRITRTGRRWARVGNLTGQLLYNIRIWISAILCYNQNYPMLEESKWNAYLSSTWVMVGAANWSQNMSVIWYKTRFMQMAWIFPEKCGSAQLVATWLPMWMGSAFLLAGTPATGDLLTSRSRAQRKFTGFLLAFPPLMWPNAMKFGSKSYNPPVNQTRSKRITVPNGRKRHKKLHRSRRGWTILTNERRLLCLWSLLSIPRSV